MVNLIAVVLATAVTLGISYVWYSPRLFGTEWMHMIGIKMKDMKGNMDLMWLPAIAGLITAYVLSMVIGEMGGYSLTNGLIMGFLAWLGFTATTSFTSNVFAHRPEKLWAIDAGQHLVSFLAMGAIIGLLGA